MESSNRVASAILGISVVLLLGLSVYALQARPNGDPSPTPFSLSVFAERLMVPEGTEVPVQLVAALSTRTASVGDRFFATVTTPVKVGGSIAIPAGAAVEGHVILTEPAVGSASGRCRLQVEYDQLAFNGHHYDLDAQSGVYTSGSEPPLTLEAGHRLLMTLDHGVRVVAPPRS